MGQLLSDTNMIEQAVTITDDEIVILGQFFVHKDYSITKKDVLLDVLGKHYNGQHIIVRMWDGENIDFSGFADFIKYLCGVLLIPQERVTFETHSNRAGNFAPKSS